MACYMYARVNTQRGLTMETVEFERFWAIYPRRQAVVAARKAWKKLKVSEELFAKMRQNIHDRLQSGEWSLDDKTHILHGSTYLNNERWDDEVIYKRPPAPKYAPDSTRGNDLAGDLHDRSWAK